MSVSFASFEDLRRGLADCANDVWEFFGSLTESQLAARRDGGWSCVDDLVHLRLSVVAVTRALQAPKLLLAVRFGVTRRGSRSYADVAEAYAQRLKGGVHAPPAFSPKPQADLEPAAYRDHLLSRWTELADRLDTALDRWNEKSVDRHLLPHPALGKVTVREMLYFTHLHNLHHIEVAQRRLREAGEADE